MVLKKIDVLFYLLKYSLFRKIFQGVQEDIDNNVEGAREILNDVITNTHKHALILYCTIIGTSFMATSIYNFTRDEIMMMLTIVLPLSAIMGVGWFVITFGAIPKKYLGVALDLTFFMCYAFIQCLAAMMLVLLVVLPLPISFVISAVIISVYISSVLYDTMDLLKSGIDEDALLFYRGANRRLYKKEKSHTS